MPNPWDRQSDESGAAYAAFCAYRDAGPTRTVRDAYRQSTGKPEASQASGTWLKWAKRYRWGERAIAYDSRDQHVAQAAHEAVVAADATAKSRESLRASRRLQQEEDEWVLRGEILEVGRKLLARVMRPVTHRRGVYYKGEKLEDLVIRRHRWNAASLAKLLTVAKDLGRLSAQMPCTISQVEPPQNPEGLREVLFETDGQFEAAVTREGAVQPMPPDVMAKPDIPAADLHVSGSRLPPPMQPGKVVRDE